MAQAGTTGSTGPETTEPDVTGTGVTGPDTGRSVEPGRSAESGGPPIRSRRISEATVLRLPVYQRILSELLRVGQSTVSSAEMAQMAGVNAAKVRKDLSFLGSFGTRGRGYDIAFLRFHIDRVLGVDHDWPVAVAGIGNLGRALVNSEGFSSRGFRVAACFDVDPAIVGERVGPVVVQHIDQIRTLTGPARPAIGVVATPVDAAQEVADAFVGVGVRSILNFAPRVLVVPPEVVLRYVDLSIELQVMSFYQSQSQARFPSSGLRPGSVVPDESPAEVAGHRLFGLQAGFPAGPEAG